MRIIPPHAMLHHKCAFDIYNDEEMSKTRKILFQWLKMKLELESNDKTLVKKFFSGNEWDRVNNVQFRTALALDNNIPCAWGMEVIHPDSEIPLRYWSVEVILKREENSIRFVATTRHFPINYYIGNSLDLPSATTPAFVSDILRSKKLICKKGDTRVLAKPVYVLANRSSSTVADIYRQLSSLERQIPFIFLSPKSDGEYILVPNELARKTCGNANIYIFKDVAAIDELNYHIGHFSQGFHYKIGTFGCYLPDVNFSNTKTWHSYRQHNDSDSITIDSIVNGVSRYLKSRASEFDTLRSVMMMRNKLNYQKLHHAHKDAEEMNELYSSENDELTQEIKTLKKEINSKNKDIEVYTEWNDAIVKDLEAVKSESKNWHTKFNDMCEKYNQKKQECDCLEKLKGILHKYVKDLKTQLELFAELNSDKIIVLDEAYTSAKNYSKWTQLDISWEMLESIIEVLYPLVFSHDESANKKCNIEQEYDSRCRFHLALKEGAQTNSSSDLQKIRQRQYDGKHINISPHIVYGTKEPDLLRIHYYQDNKNKKIVIGHCGQHLQNASTSKARK